MEGFEKREENELFSKSVKAGKRTYFFDVKSTRGNDFYMTITESKKRFSEDGKFKYEKHKLFLYKEDFEKFVEGLNETIAKIAELNAENPQVEASNSNKKDSFSNVDFDEI
jgi:hypothetical protein